GEQAGEDVMYEEAQVSRRGDRDDKAQRPCGVESVPVARGERQAPEHLGVPQRQVAQPPEPLGAPGVPREASRVLITPRVREPQPAEHRQRQERRPEGECRRGEERGTTRLVGRHRRQRLTLADWWTPVDGAAARAWRRLPLPPFRSAGPATACSRLTRRRSPATRRAGRRPRASAPP